MAAKLLQKRFGIENINEWLQENDQDGDGKMNFKEFYTSVKNALLLKDNDPVAALGSRIGRAFIE